MTHKSFSEYLSSSSFIRKLLAVVQPIYARQLKEFIQNNYSGTLDIYGTEKEKHLKSIMFSVGSLQSYFEDLDKVMIFLKVDKSKISVLYEDTIDIDDYYKYHYDNFIIRIVTSIDICGKIGNLIYDLKIAEKYANWHSFSVHPNIKNTTSAQKILEFSEYLEDFKNLRHTKVHQGKNPKNRFDEIVFWESINKLIGKQNDKDDLVLQQYTQEQIEIVIDEMQKVISNTAKFTFEFLDSMITKLDDIIND